MTYIIIIITALISFKAFSDYSLFDKLKYNKSRVIIHKEYYRLITHAFLHADLNHLIFNMITLLFFGPDVERVLTGEFGMVGGIIMYIGLYISAAATSSVPSLLNKRHADYYTAVGASGATSAMVFALILFYPKSYIFFIPAYLYGIIYLAVSHYMAKHSNDNIAHDAHFWGSVYGFIFPILFKFDFLVWFFREFGINIRYFFS